MDIHPVIGTDKVERAEFKTLAVFSILTTLLNTFLQQHKCMRETKRALLKRMLIWLRLIFARIA